MSPGRAATRIRHRPTDLRGSALADSAAGTFTEKKTFHAAAPTTQRQDRHKHDNRQYTIIHFKFLDMQSERFRQSQVTDRSKLRRVL